MKKVTSLILAILFVIMLCSCEKKREEPQIEQIRAICELSTVKAYYNNVAKSEKKASKWHPFEKDREFWIEYDGVAEIGIDMNNVEMTVKDNVVYIKLPKAELLNTYIVRETFDESCYIRSEDSWWDKNKITTEDQQKAINKGQNEMREQVSKNKNLFARAERVAKEVIKNYINKIGEISGVELEIVWK